MSQEPISYVSAVSSADYSPSFRDTERLEIFDQQETDSYISSTFLPYPYYTLAALPPFPHYPPDGDRQGFGGYNEHDSSTSWCHDRTDTVTYPLSGDSYSAMSPAGQERRRLKNFFNVLGSFNPSQQETINKCDEVERTTTTHFRSTEEHPLTAAAAVEACNLEFAQSLRIAETQLTGLQRYTINAANDRFFFWAKEHVAVFSDDTSPPPSPPPPAADDGDDRYENCSPLIQATAGGHRDTVKSLLAQGDNVNAVDQGGRTALLVASALGYIEIINLLLKNGANVNAQTNMGISPLMVAVRSGCLETTCTLLGYHPLDLTIAETQSGYTALMLAISTSSQDALMEMLIRCHKSTDLDAQDFSGLTALMHAAIRGKADVASLLLRQGAACDVQDFEGKTALHHAAERGCLTLVMDLLDSNADPNKQDYQGYTPLMYSLENNQVLTSYRILQGPQHVDLLPKSKNGRSALAIAAEKRQRHIFAELLRRSIPLDSSIFRKARALVLEE